MFVWGLVKRGGGVGGRGGGMNGQWSNEWLRWGFGWCFFEELRYLRWEEVRERGGCAFSCSFLSFLVGWSGKEYERGNLVGGGLHRLVRWNIYICIYIPNGVCDGRMDGWYGCMMSQNFQAE